MFIQFEEKSIVVGLKWGIVLDNSNYAKAARAAKSKLMWSSLGQHHFGVLAGDDLSIKKVPTEVYSAAILLSSLYVEKNVIGIFTIPGSDAFAIVGLLQGRPKDGFDTVIEVTSQINDYLLRFKEICTNGDYELVGDINVDGMAALSLDDLIRHASEHARLVKVGSALLNPVTMTLLALIIVFVCYESWVRYKVYRNNQLAAQRLSQQKSAQQMYDEALALKRNEKVLLARQAAVMLKRIEDFPRSIGGWLLEQGSCNVNPNGQVICVSKFIKGTSIEASNRTFSAEAKEYGFKTVVYASDLKSIETTNVFDDIPMVTFGAAIDVADLQERIVVNFGSEIQGLFKYGSAQKLGKFEPFALPKGIALGQLKKKPTLVSKWEFGGSMRVLEVFGAYEKYAVITSISYKLDKAAKFNFNDSFAKVAVTGFVFAKQE